MFNTIKVNLILYNIIIPPLVTNAAPTKIGSFDSILSDRVATFTWNSSPAVGAADVLVIQNTPISNYYFTNLELTYIQLSTSAPVLVNYTVYDGKFNGDLHSVLSTGSFQTLASPGQVLLTRVQSVIMSGNNSLYFRSSSAGAAAGVFNLQIYGGYTNAVISYNF